LAVLLALALVLAGLSTQSAGAVAITEFPLPPGSGPFFITGGPDGNMWFTDKGNNTIGKIGMNGEVTQYGLGITPNAGLNGITTGPEGNLWFTEREGHKIGRITTGGAVTEFSQGLTGAPDIYGITTGPEGNLWFTETFSSRLGVISPTTGAIKEIPGPTGVYTAIVRGPEGNLWYTVPDQATINRVTAAGESKAFGPLSAADCAVGATTPCPYPDNIVVGAEGNLWTNEARGNAIVRVTPSGGISEYTDGLTHGAGVEGLATGPEGDIWFTESQADQIGRITPTGVITEFSTGLSKEASPLGIALGPDQNLWVTEASGNRIARVIPDVPPIVTIGSASSVYRTHATVGGTVRSRGADTHYFFEYGPLGTYATGTAQVDNGNSDSAVSVSTELKGLTPGAAYQFRIVAQNANGTSVSSDGTFTTAPEVAHQPKKKHHRKHKAKLTVKPFQMYFSGRALGRRQLLLHKIILLGLRRGEKVSYKCLHCQGGPSRAHLRTPRSRLVFSTGLKVGGRSRLRIAVSAKKGGTRVKLYGFRIAAAESKLKRQRCFASGKRHKPIACAAAAHHVGDSHRHRHEKT
jgi:sugar lactone lactonase YvrE